MGPIFVYGSFALICALAPLRPAIGALGYVGFVAFCPQFLWRFSLSNAQFEFQKYIALATLAGIVISGFKGAELSRLTMKCCVCLCLYLALSFVSAFQTEIPERSWFFMNNIYKIVLMTVVTIWVIDSPRVLQAAFLVMLFGIGWNAIEINQDYFSRGYSTVNYDGWAFQNANGYALVLVLGALMSVSAAVAYRALPARVVFLLLALAEVHAIFIVESRGGMVGLIAAGAAWLVFVKKDAASWSILALALIGAMALAGPSVVREFSSTFADDSQRDESANSRFYIWRAGLEITADYPLLGVGPWAAERKVVEYYKDPAGAPLDRMHLHNLPLEISTGSGIPALTAYCVFFFAPLFRAASLLRKGGDEHPPTTTAIWLGVGSGMVGYWVASCFNSGALIEVPYLCIAFVIAAITLSDKSQQEERGTWEATETSV